MIEGEIASPVAEPIATPAPEETVTQEQPEPAPEKTFTQAELEEILEKRIARERRKLEKLERQRDVELEVQRRLAEMQAQQAPKSDGPPKREDFESLEDYLEAKADWKVEQKLSEAERRRQEAEAVREAENRQRQYTETWEQRASKAAETYPDFDEVVTRNEDLPITPVMAQAIQGAENGTDVAYHLGKNPKEAARIASLDPVLQVYELGRLSTALQKPAEKPVSQAAPPIEPVRSGRSSRNDIYEDGISVEEYIKRRKAQLKAG